MSELKDRIANLGSSTIGAFIFGFITMSGFFEGDWVAIQSAFSTWADASEALYWALGTIKLGQISIAGAVAFIMYRYKNPAK